MVIIGAKGFAKELLALLHENNETTELYFFDDINLDVGDYLYDEFPVIKSWGALHTHFSSNSPLFALGIGGAGSRENLSKKVTEIGGQLCSVISKKALIGAYGNSIGNGVCILSQATITCDVSIGEGSLINKSAIISHDVSIGRFCIVSPGAKILGRSHIGNFTEIGANAVILPDIKIGNNCIVGAGAIVTKDIQDNTTVIGNPAKLLSC